MAKFDAATAVESLDYDFTAYGGSEGTIREPSTGDINQFIKANREMAREFRAKAKNLETDKDPDEMTVDDTLDLLEEVDDEVFTSGIAQATADLCGGQPTYDEIAALPLRVQIAFIRWMQEAIRPEV